MNGAMIPGAGIPSDVKNCVTWSSCPACPIRFARTASPNKGATTRRKGDCRLDAARISRRYKRSMAAFHIGSPRRQNHPLRDQDANHSSIRARISSSGSGLSSKTASMASPTGWPERAPGAGGTRRVEALVERR